MTLIYFFAYLCLKPPKKTDGDNKELPESIDLHKEETIHKTEKSIISGDKTFTINTKDYGTQRLEPDSTVMACNLENNTNQTLGITKTENINFPCVNKSERNECQEEVNVWNDYPKLILNDITWDKLYTYIFDYQKRELTLKCDPSNFIKPYNHDKIAIANDAILQIRKATCLSELKEIRLLVKDIGVTISTAQIYDYLCKICLPTNYIGKIEEFQNANELYNQIQNSNMQYNDLEKILDEAHAKRLCIPEIDEHIGEKRYLTWQIVVLIFCICWEIVHLSLWIAKGTLYNSLQYFFPIQTTNIAKYDFSEFLVFGVAFPIVVLLIIRVYKYFNHYKNED